MSNPGSISILLEELRTGDEPAFEQFFDRFFDRLKSVARKRVSVRDRKVVDDEDLAVWAMNTFQRCVRDGMYPKIRNRQDVWKFLVSILERKSVDHIRRQHAEKRGGGEVRGESVFEDQNQPRVIERVCIEKSNFELMVDFLDVLDVIVDRLNDPLLGEVLAAKFAGHSTKEIANITGKSVSSVDRKLRLIRTIIARDKDLGFVSSSDID